MKIEYIEKVKSLLEELDMLKHVVNDDRYYGLSYWGRNEKSELFHLLANTKDWENKLLSQVLKDRITKVLEDRICEIKNEIEKL